MSFGTINAGSYVVPRQTQTADTPIVDIIPGMPGKRTKVGSFSYESAGTAHTVYAMRELSRVKTSAAALAAATSLILTSDPGYYSGQFANGRRPAPAVADNLIAANDYIGVRLTNGAWWKTIVSAVTTNGDGTVTLTVAAIPTGGIPANAPVAFFGITTDQHPLDRSLNPAFVTTASAVTNYPEPNNANAPVAQSLTCDSPILIYSANGTAAGVLHNATALYG